MWLPKDKMSRIKKKRKINVLRIKTLNIFEMLPIDKQLLLWSLSKENNKSSAIEQFDEAIKINIKNDCDKVCIYIIK